MSLTNFNGINNYLPGTYPTAQVTPFTYREGATMLHIIDSFKEWAKRFGPVVESALNDAFDEFQKQIDSTKVGWQELFDQFIENITQELMTLNDASIGRLLKDNQSNTYQESARLSLKSHVSLERGKTADYSYEYFVIKNALKMPGSITKRIAGDYDQNWNGESPFTPPFETIQKAYKETGASVIVSGSGYNADVNHPEYGRLYGAQIKDGVILRDFNVGSSPRGVYALGIHNDGSAKVYSTLRGDTAQSMLNAGVVDSFSFGPELVNNGVASTITGGEKSARCAIGVKGNDFIILNVSGVTGKSGITYQGLATMMKEYGCSAAVAMDGGGSVQSLGNGEIIHPSSDNSNRALPDYIVVNVPFHGVAESNWYDLELVNGFSAFNTVQVVTPPQVQIKNGMVHYRGAVINAEQEPATVVVGAKIPHWAKPTLYQRVPYTTGGNPQYFDVDNYLNVHFYTQNSNPGPRYLNQIKYPAQPLQ